MYHTQGVYYAINRTEKFGNVCPSLITLNITSHDHIIMISGSVSVNVTQYGPVNLYIGGLPGKHKLGLNDGKNNAISQMTSNYHDSEYYSDNCSASIYRISVVYRSDIQEGR